MNTTQEQNLKLLSTFHYVVGGMIALFSLIPVIHVIAGIALLLVEPEKPADKAPMMFVGTIFVIIAGIIILLGETLAVLIILSGRYLSQRRRLNYCFIVACIECLIMPFGTILGVFTIILLQQAEVKSDFLPS